MNTIEHIEGLITKFDYINKEVCLSHIVSALDHFDDMQAISEEYYYPDGNFTDLIALVGKI